MSRKQTSRSAVVTGTKSAQRAANKQRGKKKGKKGAPEITATQLARLETLATKAGKLGKEFRLARFAVYEYVFKVLHKNGKRVRRLPNGVGAKVLETSGGTAGELSRYVNARLKKATPKQITTAPTTAVALLARKENGIPLDKLEAVSAEIAKDGEKVVRKRYAPPADKNTDPRESDKGSPAALCVVAGCTDDVDGAIPLSPKHIPVCRTHLRQFNAAYVPAETRKRRTGTGS